jgi:hypothetical protein
MSPHSDAAAEIKAGMIRAATELFHDEGVNEPEI